MNKRIISLFLVVILIVSVILTLMPISLGDGPTSAGKEIEDFINGNTEPADETLPDKTLEFAGAIITIFQLVGVGVAVIMLIVLAMKYMIAAPGDKADIKKHAVPYIVGAVCLFAGAGILQIIETFANNLNDASNAGEGEET